MSLARRTRRDLSNKNIRKIIHKQQKESRQQADSRQKSSPGLLAILKPFLYFLLVICLVFVVYQVYTSLNFSDIFLKPDTVSIANQERKLPDRKAEEEEMKPPIKPVPQKTQVEVLNGCGVAGIAKKVTDFLREAKIDVVYLGNHKNFKVSTSQVIDRGGDLDKAREIADMLGIDKKTVKSEIDKSKQLQASIILGKDYKNLKPFKKK